MTLFVFRARWFSGVEWAWKDQTLLAVDEESVRSYVDERTPREYRDRRYAKPEGQDSLTIEKGEEAKLPYFLHAT